MKNSQSQRLSTVHTAAAVLFLLLLSPLAIFAQAALTPDQVVGTYKATVKAPNGDISVTLEIKSDNGKLSGRMITPKGETTFASSAIAAGKMTIKVGEGANVATLVLQPKDGNLAGDWTEGAKTNPVEFRKSPSVAEQLTGEWNAVADASGQPFEFLITLKVEGETITGSSSSQLGTSTISSGTVKDGKLAFILEGSNGKIAMTATLTDGKLIGDFDYSGQLSGKWVATKKTP
jgi:hypothetical protein